MTGACADIGPISNQEVRRKTYVCYARRIGRKGHIRSIAGEKLVMTCTQPKVACKNSTEVAEIQGEEAAKSVVPPLAALTA